MNAPIPMAAGMRRHVDNQWPGPSRTATIRQAAERLAVLAGGQVYKSKCPAGATLFASGAPAERCYLVVSGMLVIERRGRSGRPSRRLACPGDLVIGNCGDVRAADCTAVVDAEVLAVDRQRLDARAVHDPVLRCWLQEVHARELEMLLDTLGGGCAHDVHAGDGDRRPAFQRLHLSERGPRTRHLRAA